MARRPYTGRTTSAFGPRLAPIPGASTFHQGLDGVGGYNTAPEGGTIVGYSYAGGWGNRIVFQGDSGTVHYLAHNAPNGLLGKVGKWYPEGTNLGIKGMTGTATGVHVHWETRPRNGAPIDPETWLRSQGGTAGNGTTPTGDDDMSAETESQIGAIYAALFGPRNLTGTKAPLKWLNIDGSSQSANYGVLPVVIHNQTLIARQSGQIAALAAAVNGLAAGEGADPAAILAAAREGAAEALADIPVADTAAIVEAVRAAIAEHGVTGVSADDVADKLAERLKN